MHLHSTFIPSHSSTPRLADRVTPPDLREATTTTTSSSSSSSSSSSPPRSNNKDPVPGGQRSGQRRKMASGQSRRWPARPACIVLVANGIVPSGLRNRGSSIYWCCSALVACPELASSLVTQGPRGGRGQPESACDRTPDRPVMRDESCYSPWSPLLLPGRCAKIDNLSPEMGGRGEEWSYTARCVSCLMEEGGLHHLALQSPSPGDWPADHRPPSLHSSGGD
ncbi:hypothetical protein BO71DRAFT_91264 [Aspergillus ellipticus CBS 707.79]|uniref:Uncharacterized protein n=1 Tax=Aspergillus ellipticus CBS 707.79 TaxID=1448320 RepID=A0A319CXQ4_9EURO|nr:hypothetical protein BO71DRAFT_91264 [Aspergillus ellipticus CBS 707.79]